MSHKNLIEENVWKKCLSKDILVLARSLQTSLFQQYILIKLYLKLTERSMFLAPRISAVHAVSYIIISYQAIGAGSSLIVFILSHLPTMKIYFMT